MRSLSFYLFLIVFLSTAVAIAAERGERRADRGLELMLRPGFGAASSESPLQLKSGVNPGGDPGALLSGASAYGSGFVGDASLGYRAHPLVGFGLAAGLRSSSASALADGTTDLSRSAYSAGFYVRAYPLARHVLGERFDPWLSIGIRYQHDRQTFRRPTPVAGGGSVVADHSIDHHAIGVPVGLGLDYRVHERFALGPSFQYTPAFGIAGCFEQRAPGFVPNEQCSNSEPASRFLEAKSYGTWAVALDLRLTLF
jgi:opacity protein-like surface antigen